MPGDVIPLHLFKEAIFSVPNKTQGVWEVEMSVELSADLDAADVVWNEIFESHQVVHVVMTGSNNGK
eukprot:CAMPEP_0113709630 /NCGR_PEP_ID=MMETSP0038_2-20120614/29684_1 /TAXON_ID=2898 /ORGANISM="Cryptomonas paramecium" /LENGTH=66 /DNA_ID=CAMNT_0000635549 /DNA_START=147 /DNA_END=344 /DNA_ORIENTATION=+ /assembly_acc=CAM_ASM_000170